MKAFPIEVHQGPRLGLKRRRLLPLEELLLHGVVVDARDVKGADDLRGPSQEVKRTKGRGKA